MKKRKIAITKPMQKVALDILSDLEILMMKNIEIPKELIEIFNKHKDKYNLCEDPFTQMLCLPEEFSKNCLEYEKQLMIEKYGHCDGLE